MWRDDRPEYIDICHPTKGQSHKDIVLWSHDGGKLELCSLLPLTNLDDFEWFLKRNPRHDADGRVDTVRKVGELTFAPEVDDRLAKRIADDAIAAFPGVKFWVFRGSDWGVTIQRFWESVA